MKRNQRQQNDEFERRLELMVADSDDDVIELDASIESLLEEVDNVGVKIRAYLAHDAIEGYIDPAPRYLH